MEQKMKPNEIMKGIDNIEDFINKASKKMPDRNNRGFIDHMVYLQIVLNSMRNILSYVDNPHLDYLIRLEQKQQKKEK
tara:strand:+ start:155 stop:388 length:234 start_codon:yes stop_codon:yes gene_type:complete